jgi:hypothetical protein
MPFDAVAETLLKGGTAPRHVRRYVRELDEHLDDLTAQQCEAGYNAEDAVVRARARLGSNAELASAMLEQKQFRALAARAPWAVFTVLPPVVALALGMVSIGALVLIGKHYGFLERNTPLPPEWFRALATGTVAITNLITMPLAACLFVAIAARQRLNPVWPLAATTLLLLLFIHSEVRFALPGHPDGRLAIGFAPVFMAPALRMMAEHWPLVTAQYVLTLLPGLWLYRTHRRMG